jgi:uncharacterized cupin superfamily protein
MKIKALSLMIVAAMAVGCGSAKEVVKDQTAEVEAKADDAAKEAKEAVAEVVPDAVTASPDVYKVISDKDGVRVIEMNLAAGKKDIWHSHAPEMVYIVTGSKMKIHTPDGKFTEMEPPNGASVEFAEGVVSHQVENVGENNLRAIIFEVSKEAKASAPEGEAAPPAVDASPDVYTLVKDGVLGRLLNMKLAAGKSDKPHSHHGEWFYALKGGKIEITMPGKEVAKMEVPAGASMNNPALPNHMVKNAGDAEVEVVIFELK